MEIEKTRPENHLTALDDLQKRTLRERCYELALRSIPMATKGVDGIFSETNYTKKAQEIYEYITEGKVKE